MLKTCILNGRRIMGFSRRQQAGRAFQPEGMACKGLEVGAGSHVPGKTENPS